MIGSVGCRYFTATRYLLLEQAKNRTAILLLVAFVPIWYYIVSLFSTQYMPAPFMFRATGGILHVSSYNLLLLTAGMNAITLIVGFILFTSTRKNRQFDRRLVLNGYPQPLLILAKLTSLVIVAAVYHFIQAAFSPLSGILTHYPLSGLVSFAQPFATVGWVCCSVFSYPENSKAFL
jgi:hypothetical protein